MKSIYPIKPLGDILTLEYGKPLPESDRDPDGDVPAYGANGVLCWTKKALRKKPSIIVGRKGSAGEVTLTEGPFWPTDVTYFVEHNERATDLRYLFHILKFLKLQALAKGVKPGINRNDVYALRVPIPTLAEQERIVAIVDETFEGINTAAENAQKNLASTKKLFKFYHHSIFTRRHKKWGEKRLGDICDFVRGPFGGSLKKSIFVEDGYVVYEQQHAIYDQFVDVRYFIDAAKFKEMRRFELRPNDLIMSCSGTMGRVAVVPEGIRPGIINQALLKLTPARNISTAFLKAWMESEAFQDAIGEYSGGAAIQNVASVKVLKEIRVPLPSFDEQEKIVKELNKFYTETNRLENIYRRKRDHLEELKQSVLKKAFAGELTARSAQAVQEAAE